MTKIPLIDQEL